jgi:REP element-mobilizing transposase RayT
MWQQEAWGHLSTINNCIDGGTAITQSAVPVSRPLRIVIENGWYHVMNRGIDARRLFPDNKANEHFRELLARMPTRFGLRIHAYVLMGKHYHLQSLVQCFLQPLTSQARPAFSGAFQSRLARP